MTEPTGLEQRVARLEDIEAIRRLKVRYAELCDEGFDPDQLVALWTADGAWDAGEHGRFVGADAMRAYWADTAAVTDFAHHYLANHVVDVDPSGLVASGRAYLLATATRQGQAFWMAVRYEETYRKVDGVWLFTNMRLLPAFMTPYEYSWAHDPA